MKQAVYVLPDSPSAREDFEWLKTEIEGAGGQAAVFAANSVNAWSDDELVGELLPCASLGFRYTPAWTFWRGIAIHHVAVRARIDELTR